jgi:hypothetical protein
MLMQGRVLVGKIQQITTKKGQLAKSALKVVDMGPECSSDVIVYWIDFLGDAALTQVELDSILGEQFTIDIRLVQASKGNDGRTFLNVKGGAIVTPDGQVVQAGLRHRQELKRAS